MKIPILYNLRSLRARPTSTLATAFGMALVVAGLCAEGVTTIEHAEIIQRGYEDVATRLASIGAEISEEMDQETDRVTSG